MSVRAERLLRSDVRPAISDLVEVEFFSAVARKVRGREMPARDAARVGARFLDHLRGGLYARVAVERRHYEIARSWLARFTLPLRALDSLHLAVAETARLPLATADRDLASAARILGLTVTVIRG
jgi:predicted nucleic acid-binding protein